MSGAPFWRGGGYRLIAAPDLPGDAYAYLTLGDVTCVGSAVAGPHTDANANITLDDQTVSGTAMASALADANITLDDTTVSGTATAASAAPVITSLNFSLGDPLGDGQVIVFTGTNLGTATTATFGATSVAATPLGPTLASAVLPAHASGVTTCSLTTPSGTSNTLPFEYWSPLQAANLVSHFDASAGITLAGGLVTDWADQNGANNLTQANPAKQPAIAAASFGTLPGVLYTQGADSLHASPGVAFPSSYACMLVAKTTSARAASTYAGNAPNNGIGDDTFSILGGFGTTAADNNAGHPPGVRYNYFAGGFVSIDADMPNVLDGNPHVIGVSNASGPGNAVKIYGDGAVLRTATANIAGNNGQYWQSIGGAYLGSDAFGGTIGAASIFSDLMTGGDQTKYNLWARQRYGTPFTPASLPLTLWVKAGGYNAVAGTWAASASAGISGTVPLATTATFDLPTDGVTLNGHKTVRFAQSGGGTNCSQLDTSPNGKTVGDILENAGSLDNWTASFLINVAAYGIAGSNTAQDIRNNPAVLGCKTATYWAAVYGNATNGFTGYYYGGPYEDASGGVTAWAGLPFVLSTWLKVQVRFSTAPGPVYTYQCRVNGGAWLTSNPITPLSVGGIAQTITMGASSAGAANTGVNADVAEAFITNVALSDADLDAVNAYYANTYGV